MSYDLAICVKVEGCDKFVCIRTPEYDSPTYNLRNMFVACMDWNYSQSERDENGEWKTVYYSCEFALEKIKRGIIELTLNRDKYEKYNPENGWGSLDGALKCLDSLRRAILEESQYIPLDCLYMRW